jgi:hypothetical protein
LDIGGAHKMNQTLQYPIFVRISTTISGEFQSKNDSFFETEGSEEKSIMFVATPIHEHKQYLDVNGEWKELEYKYEKNEFYIFVSRESYNEVKYEYEYKRQRNRMFAISYHVTHDRKTGKIKTEWNGINSNSTPECRQELLSMVMSK